MKLALGDAADQKALRTLLSAKADYLMTGDKDLLPLAEKYPNCHAVGVLAAPRLRSTAGIGCPHGFECIENIGDAVSC
jgi:hypothetical protein